MKNITVFTLEKYNTALFDISGVIVLIAIECLENKKILKNAHEC